MRIATATPGVPQGKPSGTATTEAAVRYPVNAICALECPIAKRQTPTAIARQFAPLATAKISNSLTDGGHFSPSISGIEKSAVSDIPTDIGKIITEIVEIADRNSFRTALLSDEFRPITGIKDA